jgi:hypothetical protein
MVRHNEQSVAEKKTVREGTEKRDAIFPILHCKQAARGGQPRHAAHIMSNDTYNSTCPHNWFRAKPRRNQAGGKRSPFLPLALPLARCTFRVPGHHNGCSHCGNTMQCVAVYCIACWYPCCCMMTDHGRRGVQNRAALEESRWVRVSTAEQKVDVCACMAAVQAAVAPIVDPAPTPRTTPVWDPSTLARMQFEQGSDCTGLLASGRVSPMASLRGSATWVGSNLWAFSVVHPRSAWLPDSRVHMPHHVPDSRVRMSHHVPDSRVHMSHHVPDSRVHISHHVPAAWTTAGAILSR